MSTMPNLREVVLISCGLQNSDMKILGEIKAPLEKLVLDDNALTQESLKHIQELSSLKHLSIVANPANTEDDPTALLTLVSLLGSLENMILPMPNVVRLGDGPFKMSWNLLDERRALLLATNLPNLRQLCLSICTLPSMTRFVSQFHKLRSLNMDANTLTTDLLAAVSEKLHLVRELSLGTAYSNQNGAK